MSWNGIPWIDILGYAASLAVFATFCMGTMMPLRYAAIASNVLFVAFGYFGHIYPVLILHVVLLPVNVLRLMQIKRIVRDIQSHSPDQALRSLLPFMQARRFSAGIVLVRKGESADRLFYLAEGELGIEELNKTIGPGAVIGEVGVFAPDQRRMATVTCKSDCRIYEMTGAKVKELYFQDPSFGYAVLQLIIERLLENQMRVTQLQQPS